MKERKTELEAIRVIACFLVVTLHVVGYGMEVMNPRTANWMTRNLIKCLIQCAAPLFFMISGSLFMEKEVSMKTLYGKYIARLLVAWTVWSGLYAAIDYIAHRKTGLADWRYFLSRFTEGHYHMWFLQALFTVYVFLPVIQSFVRACPERCMKYLGAILLTGVIGKETLDPFLESPAWDALWKNLAVPCSSAGILYFVLGYFLYKTYGRYSAKRYLAVYTLTAAVMAGINLACAYKSGGHEAAANGYLSVFVLISSASFFLFLLRVFSAWKLKERPTRWIRAISECTFGIYLVHTLLIEQVYRRVGLTQERFPTLASIALFTAMTFLISFLISWCIRKTPLVGKWIA